MKKNKSRQHIKDGAIVKIELLDDKMAFGILILGRIGIYDYVVPKRMPDPPIERIISKPIFLYCTFYKDVITKGEFEIIGFKLLTNHDIKNVPPKFTQDRVNLNDCIIYWHDGTEQKASPEECLGLERSSVWNAEGIKLRIEDHYAGRKNSSEELLKPILTQDDIRYDAGPFLRWNFEKQEFYRVSENQVKEDFKSGKMS